MKMMLVLLMLILQTAQAIPEKGFHQKWHQDVLPYFAGAHQRTFINPQGMKLNFYSLVKSEHTKTIVILPGRTEPALKYAELAFDLKDAGFNLYILDHQGQGASDRLLKDTHKSHVKHFIDYARDLSQWLDEVVIPESPEHERYLIAHSMGGTIATLYLAYGKSTFQKAVLSAPMMEIDTKPYKEKIGRLLTGALVLAGRGNSYAPDRGPYIAENDTFEKNEMTHSLSRFEAAKAIFVTWPELITGGPTARWVNQSLKTTKKIHQLAPRIKTPILMLQAGEDLIVKPSRQNAFCSRHSTCRKIHFPHARHEILQESDEIRDEALSEIKNFLMN